MATTRTSTSAATTARLHLLDRPAVMEHGRAPFLLSGLLALAAVAAALPSLAFPDLLGGAEVMKGNLRGTAVVVLATVPVLVTAMTLTARNSARWLLVWGGSAAYLLYQAVLFCFTTPYNSLFLAYVAFLGLAIYTLITLLAHVHLPGFASRVGARMPVRVVAGFTLAFAALNGLAWLARIAPTVASEDPAGVLEGSGLLTSPVWVQDLAFWIPAALVAGMWTWRRHSRGVLLVGAFLVFSVLECLSIASDQWWGARADDRYPEWASMTAVPVFLAAAALTVVPLVLVLRHIDRGRRADG